MYCYLYGRLSVQAAKYVMKRIHTIDQDSTKQKKGKNRAGVALIEALVAITIFAIFITGAGKLLLAHRKISDMARMHYTAANVAKNRLELIRSFDFDERDEFMENNVVVNMSGLQDDAGHYRRSTTIVNTSSNICEMTVSVEILDRKTLTFSGRNETVQTLMAEYNARPNPGGS